MKANIIFFALLLLSCNSGSNKRKAEVERFTKLEEFLLLPFDSVMNMYDLSNYMECRGRTRPDSGSSSCVLPADM